MGYIYGPKRNESFTFTVRILTVADGEFAINPTIVAGDWKRSINGGTLAALGTTPTVSPAGSSQIVIELGVAENPGDFTTIQFIDLTGPKEFHDNAWEVHSTVVGSGSGAVITVNPSAFVDSEAIANLVGPYIANLLINSLNLPTAGEWAQLLAQNALITAIKSKSDLMTFTGSLLQTTVHSFATAAQADLRTQLYTALSEPGKTIAELVGVVPVNPTWAEAMAWLVHIARNGGMQSDSVKTVHNSTGQIASQAVDNNGSSIIWQPFITS